MKESRIPSGPGPFTWPALVGLALSLHGLAGCAEVGESEPAPAAIYADGVVSSAGATLAILGAVSGEGPGYMQAGLEALEAAEARLAEVGLDRGAILKVRAALAPGDGTEFGAWNEAWTDFFPAGEAPARTTVGSSGLPGEALVILDVVAQLPEGSSFPGASEAMRATANPNILLAGPSEHPMAIVSTVNGLFMSAGVLPSRGTLENPDLMEEQIRSVISRLGGSLEDHGLDWGDAFFLRVLPTPQPGLEEPDFAGWYPVEETMTELSGGTPIPYSMWAAPGFSANGNFVEIEVWATWPMEFPPPLEEAISVEPLLRMSGSPTGQIASGASIAPEAELVWLSGVIAPEGTAPEDEGMAALDEMKDRLEAMGASMAGVAELRVYRVPGESGFGAGYSAHFNNPEVNPHRPARTNYLVESLPAGRSVMVEAVVVRSPEGM